jgi:predicted nucleotide-binding protein
MAKTASRPGEYTDVPAARIPATIAKLQRCLAGIVAVPAPKDTDEIALRAHAICDRSNDAYREIFGPESLQAREAEVTTEVFYDSYATYWHEEVKRFEDTRKRVLGRIETTITLLQEKLSDLDSATSVSPLTISAAADLPPNGAVFLVHGHDGAAKIEVARLLERAGLDVKILHEQPNGGHTIVEKFEEHATAAGFAVVLLTPDDVGGPVGGLMKPRARQNVVGEMFWFAGKLGRERVCALRKGDVEIPSDFAGLLYTEMDDRGAWKQELLRELQNAGYDVDWPRALA